MKYPYTQNREISWLSFNERVLDKANDKTTPLMERLKFFEIFISNLDEFFMIRVGSLENIKELNPETKDSKTDMSVASQLHSIIEHVKPLIKKKDDVFKNLLDDLDKENIHFCKLEDFNPEVRKELKKYFKNEILPLLSPQILDFNHPFPHIENKMLYLIATLNVKSDSVLGLVQIPNSIPKYKQIENDYILIEQLIYDFADLIFKKYEIIHKNIISITRNADISLDDAENDDVYDYKNIMKGLIKKRCRLKPVRLECSNQLNTFEERILLQKLELPKSNVFVSKSPLKFNFIYDLISGYNQKYFYPKLVQKDNMYINTCDKIIPQISKHDALLFYPFESMEPFLKLIKEAATDKSVVSIKITIYRLSKKSKLVDYLCQAAENGKDVQILIELRARFDEQNNIDFSEKLEDSGCHIMYGFEHYKVHSKICLITRKSNNKVSYITQIGTGNYNEKTVSIYTDYSYITSNQEIGEDANNFFNNMLLGNLTHTYNKLLVAPNTLKSGIIKLIDEQIALNENGYIFFKMNSITDIDIINKLVEASQHKVKIDLIVRGICCILPQIKDYTETITIKSIVGRFLEHSRIYLFGRDEPKMYISSADMMTRNTVRRVEIAVPILDSKIKNQILSHIEVLKNDTYNAKICNSDGSYSKIETTTYCNSHEYFLKKDIKITKKSESAKKIITDVLKQNNIKYKEAVTLELGALSKKFNFYLEDYKTYIYLLNVKTTISYNTLEKLYLLSSLLNKENYKLVVVVNSKKNEQLDESLQRINIKYYYLDNFNI